MASFGCYVPRTGHDHETVAWHDGGPLFPHPAGPGRTAWLRGLLCSAGGARAVQAAGEPAARDVLRRALAPFQDARTGVVTMKNIFRWVAGRRARERPQHAVRLAGGPRRYGWGRTGDSTRACRARLPCGLKFLRERAD